MGAARGQIHDGSQEAAILAWLRSGASLSPLEALDRFGCMRLGARIFALRRAGYRIEATTVRHGRKAWSSYRLETAAAPQPWEAT